MGVENQLVPGTKIGGGGCLYENLGKYGKICNLNRHINSGAAACEYFINHLSQVAFKPCHSLPDTKLDPILLWIKRSTRTPDSEMFSQERIQAQVFLNTTKR